MHVIAQAHTFHWVATYRCAGIKIWLRWLQVITALAWRFDFMGFKRRIRSLNEALYLIKWSGCVDRMKWLRWLNEVAALAEWSGCVGWTKWLRWQNEVAVLAERSGCVGWKKRLRWLKEAAELAERSGCVCWKKRLSWLNEVAELAEWSGWVGWIRAASPLGVPPDLQSGVRKVRPLFSGICNPQYQALIRETFSLEADCKSAKKAVEPFLSADCKSAGTPTDHNAYEP